jgi:hypothetical protein
MTGEMIPELCLKANFDISVNLLEFSYLTSQENVSHLLEVDRY